MQGWKQLYHRYKDAHRGLCALRNCSACHGVCGDTAPEPVAKYSARGRRREDVHVPLWNTAWQGLTAMLSGCACVCARVWGGGCTCCGPLMKEPCVLHRCVYQRHTHKQEGIYSKDERHGPGASSLGACT